eukprot:gene164-390_t
MGLWHPEVRSTLISVPVLCKAGGEALFKEGGYALRTVGGEWLEIQMRDDVPSVRIKILGEDEGYVECSVSECGIAFLDIVAAGFTGPYPVSLLLNTWLLSFVDQHTRWAEVFPCSQRSSAGELLDNFVSHVGRPKILRSDNATEFKSLNSTWRINAAKQNPTIECSFSAPCVPQMNGNVERFQGTLLNAVRSNLHGTDTRLWDWCARYVCYIYNRLDKQKHKSPFRMRHGRDPNLTKLRRFGSLCYSRVNQETRLHKLDDRWERGIFLGFSRNSCFLVGIYRPDARCAEGFRFNVFENRYVKVDESIVVQKVEHLMHFQKGTFTPYSLPSSLPETDVLGGVVPPESDRGVVPPESDSGAVSEGSDHPTSMAHSSPGLARSSPGLARSKTVSEKEEQSLAGVPDVDGDVIMSDESNAQPSKPDSVNVKPSASEEKKIPQAEAPNPEVSSSANDDADPRVYWENGIKKKRKGRLPGTKMQAHWQKPGPKPNLRGGSAKISNILTDLASLGRYGGAGAEPVLLEDTVQLLQMKANERRSETPVGNLQMAITRAS